jgi:hypothetical protein
MLLLLLLLLVVKLPVAAGAGPVVPATAATKAVCSRHRGQIVTPCPGQRD